MNERGIKMKMSFRNSFALLLVLFFMLLPVAALAAGGDFALGDYIGPDVGVGYTLLVVAAAIALDTILGILLGIKTKTFDVALLPQFLFTGVMVYIGALALLALLAYYIDVPFAGMFYASAAAVMAKYLADLWDKVKLLFGASPETEEPDQGV